MSTITIIKRAQEHIESRYISCMTYLNEVVLALKLTEITGDLGESNMCMYNVIRILS